MWRALGFLALLALAAFGAVWLADRPGVVTLSFGGYEATMSLAAALVGTVVLAVVLVAIWSLVSALIAFPGQARFASRARRRAKGYAAISRGMVAVGSGDPVAARRLAGEAERLLGGEPLTLLLTAQAAQISGDRSGAERAFQRMTGSPETRVLGLRGLYIEARRRNDTTAARAYAAEAAQLAPSVAWASEATLEAQGAEGDWDGAIETVRRRASLGSLEKAAAKRQRAVLLTASAAELEAGQPERATEQAVEASRLAPELVPAATLAARLLARRGDIRKAAKLVEAAWRRAPHPDLAETYAGLRSGDSTRDRLQRAETLARLSAWDPEGRIAVARAALEAREFPTARNTLAPLLAERPSVRICLLMARIEEVENGVAAGGAREWFARAARAPRDPMWIADGVAADHWAPISPVSGRLDAFTWETPRELITAAPDVPPEAEPPAPVLPVPVQPAVVPAAAASAAPAPPPVTAPLPPLAPAPAANVSREPRKPAAPVIFPVSHAPDDPGAETESEDERRRRFG